MRRISFALFTLVAACSSSGSPRTVSPAANPSQAFVDAMLSALEREDDAAWRALLSARLRDQVGNNAADLHAQMMTWRREVLPLAPTLRAGDPVVATHAERTVLTYTGDGGEPETLAVVALESGALHLDEN